MELLIPFLIPGTTFLFCFGVRWKCDMHKMAYEIDSHEGAQVLMEMLRKQIPAIAGS